MDRHHYESLSPRTSDEHRKDFKSPRAMGRRAIFQTHDDPHQEVIVDRLETILQAEKSNTPESLEVAGILQRQVIQIIDASMNGGLTLEEILGMQPERPIPQDKRIL